MTEILYLSWDFDVSILALERKKMKMFARLLKGEKQVCNKKLKACLQPSGKDSYAWKTREKEVGISTTCVRTREEEEIA